MPWHGWPYLFCYLHKRGFTKAKVYFRIDTEISKTCPEKIGKGLAGLRREVESMDKKLKRLKDMPCWMMAFLVNMAVAFIAIGSFILADGGYFALSHDFNGQEIPFNMLMNTTVKSGNLLWNWAIDIGSNFLEAFSFYNVGSIFFWITLLFPAESIPQVIGWMIIFKYAVAGAISALYLERHLEKKSIILIVSLLYTFSGFQCGSVVFYHFQDQVALFPLLLIGMEMLVEERKRGRLLFACAINALCNFVFFVGEVMFLVIYYVVRYLYPGIRKSPEEGKKSLYNIIPCMLEGIIGTAIAGILLVPSVSGIMNNTRISLHIQANAWLTMSTRNWLELIKAFFIPAECMNSYSSVVTGDWMTNMAYLPMFGMTFVIAYLLSKKDWLSSFLKVCFVMVAVPLFSSMFSFFSSGGYRRWYYMMILFMGLATGKVLENPKKFRIKTAMMISSFVMIFYFFMIRIVKWNENGESLIYYENRFKILFMVSFAGIILTYVFLSIKQKYRMTAYTLAVMAFCVFSLSSVVYKYRVTTDNTGINFSEYKGTFSENVAVYLTEFPKNLDESVLPYRYYFDEAIGHTYYNLAMTNSLASINSFISTIHPSVTELYDLLGIGRWTWTNGGYTGIRELLSARKIYSAMEHGEYRYLGEVENSNGQILIQYENDNALPIGFTYDTYMTRSEFETFEPYQRTIAMLKTLVVEDEKAALAGSCLEHFDMEKHGGVQPENLAEATTAHRKECSEYFEQGDNYFISVINADRDKYAFFSVPFDKYWKAKVNDEETEILNINGLMAVKINEGSNTIQFDYCYTPIKIGLWCTIGGLLSAGLYFIIILKRNGRLPLRKDPAR